MAAAPSAILKQRERLQAELDATNPVSEVVNLDIPPVVETSVASIPAPAIEVGVDSNLNARVKELEHLLSTRDGQTSTAMREANEARQRAEVMASQIASLEESIGTLQRQKDDAEARAKATQATNALPSLDAPDDLTEQEITTFGKDSIGFVEKLTKKELLRYIKPLLDKVGALESQVARVSELDRLPQLEKTVKNQQTEAQRLRDEEFFHKEVLAYFPDFVTIRNTQDWKEYLGEDIPGKGIKIDRLLAHYRDTNNAQGIRALIQAHYDAIKAKPNLASIATPRGAQTEGIPTVKPKMKASEYQKNLRLWTSKRLPTKDWEKFKSEFNTALKDDRVDMDVRL